MGTRISEPCGKKFGVPLNPRTDYTEWKRLLDQAGVPERRLHDARHTAATVLLLLGVPERTVMGLLWAPATEDGDDGPAGAVASAP